jgi:hypothetical protein
MLIGMESAQSFSGAYVKGSDAREPSAKEIFQAEGLSTFQTGVRLRQMVDQRCAHRREPDRKSAGIGTTPASLSLSRHDDRAEDRCRGPAVR